MKAARQEYDRSVAEALRSADIELKKRLAGIIDHLYEMGARLPSRINETRRLLAIQIARSEDGTA